MIERTYTVPLRRGWLKAARYRRAKKAVITLKEFLQRHMKSEDVRIGVSINLEMWKHGMKNPPSRVKITAVKDDKGVVRAELFGAKAPVEKKVEKKAAKPAEKKTEAPKVEATPVEKAKPAEVKKAPTKAPVKQ